MAAIKRVICLANSRKQSGRCIAGIEISRDGRPLGWIRPVSGTLHGELFEAERQYRDGIDPRLLDIIDIPLLGHLPSGHQRENWLLYQGYHWVHRGRAEMTALPAFLSSMPTLWYNGNRTQYGFNDKVSREWLEKIDSSLCLIRVETLGILVAIHGNDILHARKRVLGRFKYRGLSYGLWITDPRYESEFSTRAIGTYEIGPCFLTISLGEPFNGFAYKLIAAIIPDDGT